MKSALSSSVLCGLILLAASAPVAAQAIEDGQCRWCDRVGAWIKSYKYDFKPDTKVPDSVITNVKEVAYQPFKSHLTRRTLEGANLDQIRQIEKDTNFSYALCDSHYRLEKALAKASGDPFWPKFVEENLKGVWFRADPLSGTATSTVANYSLDNPPSKPTLYVIEIDHGGYGKEWVDRVVTRALQDRFHEFKDPELAGKFAAEIADWKSTYERDYRAANQATFRVVSWSPDGQMRDVAKESIAKAGGEITVTDGGQKVFRLRLERMPQESDRDLETAGIVDEAKKKDRDEGHWFDGGARWFVRLGHDPLDRVLARAKQRDMVTGGPQEQNVRKRIEKALAAYVDDIQSDIDKLGKDRKESDEIRLAILGTELDEARTHFADLLSIVYCQIHPSMPAVVVWQDYTDPRMPRQVSLSPWEGALQQYQSQELWSYLTPYLTVFGVLVISSLLSMFGIKGAGG